MRLLRWTLAGLLLAAVTACGGDGGQNPPAQGPSIQRFTADRSVLLAGERARLTAEFTGGQGRIEPDIGPVQSGVPVETPPLDAGRNYTLVVEAAGQPAARRALALTVGFRNRYDVLATTLRAQYHAAATTADGVALIIGGSRGETTPSDSIDRFDPVTRSFVRIGTLRTGRYGHTATRLADGRILVLGGGVGIDIGAVADVIDPRTGAASDGGALRQTRSRHATVALPDGRALVVGGYNRNTVELWDPATHSFRLVAARMSHVREYPTATVLADGRVLIAGGYTIAPAYVFAEIFDPGTETFAPVAAPISERRYFHEAHRQADGSVLILGGEVVDNDRIVPLPSVLRFDPAGGTLAPVQPLDRARTLMKSLLLPDGTVLAFGGETDTELPTAGALSYRAAGTQPLAPMPQARRFHTVSRLADGRVLIVGGDDAGGGPVTSVLLYE